MMLVKLIPEVQKLEYQLTFVRGLLSGEIQMNADILTSLKAKEFKQFRPDESSPASYAYLLELDLIVMMTNPAKVEELAAERDAKKKVAKFLEGNTKYSLWLKDLDRLIEKLDVWFTATTFI